MLPHVHRVPKAEIPRVLRFGRRIRGRGVSLIMQSSPLVPRFAFVVSSNVDKRAVVRNRYKRMLRESVQSRIRDIKPSDVVLIVHAKLPRDRKTVQDMVNELLARAEML